MHTLALQLAPILAAEKSKTPFYIAGGLLVAWALVLSLGIGSRMPDFPRNLVEQRAVMAVTAVLVLAAVATAVATSGSPAKSAIPPAATTAEIPLPTGSSSVVGATSTTAATATTGTPTPPSSPAAGAAARSLKLEANAGGALSYNTKTLSAKAGTVTITMANMSSIEHNVTIAEGSKVVGATPTFAGGSKTLTVKLKPGKYTFYCSVPGHREAGMEGTLTVQ